MGTRCERIGRSIEIVWRLGWSGKFIVMYSPSAFVTYSVLEVWWGRKLG